MRDRELYAKIMGISTPWSVEDVEVDVAGEKVLVKVVCKDGPLPCPECGKSCPRYDSRSRSWRHLDTMQFETFLVADVPGSSVRRTASARSWCLGPSRGRTSQRCSSAW